MSLRRSKLYQSIYDPSQTASVVWEQCFDYLSNKKDINIRDEENGGTILHALVENDDKFRSAVAIQVIYLVASSGLDLNVKDKEGNTCLHYVVRKKGAYRFMVALLRYRIVL
ncbi:hypothetical protein ACJMK2_043974 [Sinanodonta woodiana]|uniref:Uncharacterized protein n=1 Tax=Sinanodonta woodiana TaxID=1069815 RepID=A0ABD3W1E7_SINWO